MKIGGIIEWPSNTIPDGWLLCDGSAVSRTTYADLFSVIGTTYGAGDGSTTFNLPNRKGKVGVGLDVNDSDFNVLGKTLGSKYLQEHNHMSQIYSKNYDDNKTLSSDSAYAYTFRDENGSWAYTPTETTNGQYVKTAETLNAGNGNAGNIQPSIVANYIIKALNPDSIKISELESASSVTSSDVLPIVQNGETKKVTAETLLADIYSTNEVKTNKVWIDGKPIYRKVITGELGTNTNHGLTNFNIINMSGLYIGTNNNTFNLPSVRPSYTDYEVGFYVSLTQIVFEKPSVWAATGTFYVVLEYTKTS